MSTDTQARPAMMIEGFYFHSSEDIEQLFSKLRMEARQKASDLLYKVALAHKAKVCLMDLMEALTLYLAEMEKIRGKRKSVQEEYQKVDAKRSEAKRKYYRHEYDRKDALHQESELRRELKRLDGQATNLLNEEGILSGEYGKYSEPARRIQAAIEELNSYKAPPPPDWLLDWLTIDKTVDGK